MEVLGSLIIAIVQSILFYGRSLGISVIIFTLVTTGIIWYILHKKDQIINKKALILMIPIILLSSTYFIYGSSVFYITNMIVILGLMVLMFRMATTEKSILMILLFKYIQLPIEAIEGLDNAIQTTIKSLKEKPKGSGKFTKEKIIKCLISLVIVMAVVGIVIALLASADSIFADLFVGLENIFKDISINSISDLIARIIICVIIYFILLSLILTVQKNNVTDTKIKTYKDTDKFTIKMLLVSLNVVYAIFCYIQITSLFTKINAPGTFNYAEYARSGFFQLMFVSLINFTLLMISNYKNDNRNNFIKILNLLLIIFTIIIVLSSMYRMYMYETTYGLTYLRVFVYIILTTELILFIPASIYVFTPKLDILKWGGVIGLGVYVIINYCNLENIIITRNLGRVNSNVDIDYGYIARISSSDTYSKLEELFEDENISCDDRIEIGKKLVVIVENAKDMKWQEFNISKYKLNDKNVKDKVLQMMLKYLEIGVLGEENYFDFYTLRVNFSERYKVYRMEEIADTEIWQIAKSVDGGKKYDTVGTHIVKTQSEIVFFADGLGFYTLPDKNKEKQDLYITNDSGKTFTKVDFSTIECNSSNPEGKAFGEYYDYFYLPTQEADGTLQVLVSEEYEDEYNNRETREKYISKDNGQTWEFVQEISR